MAKLFKTKKKIENFENSEKFSKSFQDDRPQWGQKNFFFRFFQLRMIQFEKKKKKKKKKF